MGEFKVGQLYTESFESMPQREVVDNLQGICYGIEEKDYTKSLSEPELALKERELGQTGIKVKQLEDDKKEVVERFKEKLSVPKETYSKLLDTIKYKSERKHGKLYLVDDQENGTMYFFDATGMCVESRSLQPGEKQTRLKNVSQVSDA